MPTLNVFVSEKVTNVCCVVTRYFGGTLLGTGGLVRAYSRAAKMALDAAGISQMDSWRSYLLSCEYGFYDRLKRLLEEYEAVVEQTDFGSDVASDVLIRADRAKSFEKNLTLCRFPPRSERRPICMG